MVKYSPLFVIVLAAACGSVREAPPAAAPAPTMVHAGAPGEESRPVAAGAAVVTNPRHVAADVEFMRDMIAHHRQAVEMTALVAERTERQEIRMLARRIEASQDDELLQMQRWLEVRGEALPSAHAHHGHGAGGHAAMPGMLTDAQLAQLRAARGDEFDRLFLEFMIYHHEGAIEMVAALFAIEGAGQETEMFQFASHVDSDQRMEIDRMRRLLSALQRG